MAETHQPNSSCIDRFDRIDKRLQTIEDEDRVQLKDLSSIQTSLSFIHQRFDAREQQTKAIIQLASAVEHMSSEVKEVVTIVKEHDTKINDLQNKSGKLALQYLDQAFKILMGLMIGGIATAVLYYLVNASK